MFSQITSEIPMRSPIANLLEGAEMGALTDVHAAGLADLSGRGLLDVRGANSEKVIKKALKKAPKNIGDVVKVEAAAIVRVRDDHFIIIGEGSLAEIAAKLSKSLGKSHVTVTDVTHGRGHLWLVGKNAADVLPKLCGLDFSDRAFPNMFGTHSSMAKVKTLIVRADLAADMPAYHLIVDQAVAAYAWMVVFDAIAEFGGIAIESIAA